MTDEEIRTWALQEQEVKELTVDEFEHVILGLYQIQRWYDHDIPIGGFLLAVLRNNFMGACGRADSVNAKVLPLYAKFVYNNLPLDYIDRIADDEDGM